MCGIAAIFNYATGEPINGGEMGRMLAHMQRRGPDGSGEWRGLQDAVGLGHRRLSIIDLSETGAQPMVSEDGRFVVTFNGEIYNYRELRTELEGKGCVFRSQSDTEVLLHLYRLEGQAMLQKLRGMFAFAIWDDVQRGLFIARDHFGIKPLYYSDDGRTLRVASQVKALLAGGGVDTLPEPAGHVGYFLWGHVPAPYTLYRGIRNLPAGHCLTLKFGGKMRLHPYYSIPDILAQAETKNPGAVESQPSAFQPLLRSALTDSVHHHLIADVPVGVFLSSGLDSTTIAALAAEFGGQLRTVTLGFEEYRGTPNDETPLAEEVARRYGTNHQTIWVTRKDFENDLHRLLHAMDQPSCDGVNSYFISKAAAQAGLKVALSGLGGDELFGGYPSFHEIPGAVSALRPFQSCPPLGRAFRVLSAPLLKRMTSPKYAGLLEYGGTYGGAYLLRRGMFMPWELSQILDPDLVREGWDELQTLARLDDTVRGIASPHLKVSALEMTRYMRYQLLCDTDWASMEHSLEVRVPLVDVDLLRATAPMFNREPHPTKRDMARTPTFQLPSSVLDRRKTGFTVPVREWLMSSSEFFQNSKSEAHTQSERGLRGWAREVYRHFPGSRLSTPSVAATARPTQHATRKRQPASTPAATTPLPRTTKSRRILIFRIGQLGDTIVTLPAMWAVKEQFPDAYLALLCDHHPGKSYVVATELLRGTHIFDDFLLYPVTESGNFLRPLRMASLLATIRKRRFDTLVYLAPSARAPNQIARDRSFFSLAGIRTFIGMEGFDNVNGKSPATPMQEMPHESDLLLKRIALSGLPTDRHRMDLVFGKNEEDEVAKWLSPLAADGGRVWIGFAPGSKMPAKRWPLERFLEVGQRLIEHFDIWPVVFGGAEDREDANRLITAWGRGYNAAGHLSVRAAALALKHCQLYVGNDTGTMHLAAAVNVKCAALFSSRDWPGRWYPHGEGHRVFRSTIECEGCGLVKCVERKNECLNRITASEVLLGCEAILASKTVA